MSLSMTLVVVTISLLVVLAVSLVVYYGFISREKGIISSLIDGVSEQVKGLAGLSKAGEKAKRVELDIEAKEEKEKLEQDTVDMRKLLIDAIGDIKNGKYDDAVDKYIAYYNECEKLSVEYYKKFYERQEEGIVTRLLFREWTPPEGQARPVWVGYGCGAIGKKGVRFRILNALREKFFTSIKSNGKEPVYDTNKIEKIGITKEEFKSSIILVGIAGYISRGNFDKALSYQKNYKKNYENNEVDELNNWYYLSISFYRFIKTLYGQLPSSDPFCVGTIKDSDNIKNYINKEFRKVETVDYMESKGIVDFNALDYYQFVKIPYEDIRVVCTS